MAAMFFRVNPTYGVLPYSIIYMHTVCTYVDHVGINLGTHAVRWA
jgi:hypothetical protein